MKSDCRVVRIDINNIRYIEGMSEYVRIFVEENKPVITLASLQKMEERLPAHFMRVHRSYIVNLRKITEISVSVLSSIRIRTSLWVIITKNGLRNLSVS